MREPTTANFENQKPQPTATNPSEQNIAFKLCHRCHHLQDLPSMLSSSSFAVAFKLCHRMSQPRWKREATWPSLIWGESNRVKSEEKKKRQRGRDWLSGLGERGKSDAERSVLCNEWKEIFLNKIIYFLHLLWIVGYIYKNQLLIGCPKKKKTHTRMGMSFALLVA